MKLIILGSGAGGGFPQWNCNCSQCRAVRAGSPHFLARSQSSLAVSADGVGWLLINASPDLRPQIAAHPELQPAADAEVRASPIRAVALTNGDVDHIAGLLNLRESQPLEIYAASRVLQTLASNRVFDVLSSERVMRKILATDAPSELSALGLTLEAFLVPGKIALYLEDASAANFGSAPGDTLGLRVIETATRRSFFYVPGCAAMDVSLARRLAGAELVFFDGTLWSETEMLEQGLSSKTGSRMGHMNMSGKDGSLAAFRSLGVGRAVYVHINNSNPVLDARSPERATAEAGGWTIGADGMRFEL